MGACGWKSRAWPFVAAFAVVAGTAGAGARAGEAPAAAGAAVQVAQVQPAHPVQARWSPAEVAAAQARCTTLLKGLDVVTAPADPIREGDCGTPAPRQLISLGSNPQVSFSPPVMLTCDMIAALHTWVTRELQPLARTRLGGPIIQVETMSSYSCRNAYGRAKSRLSEHGHVNALDIRGFLTVNGANTTVLADWGIPEREIEAKIAAAKAAASKLSANRAVAAAPSPQRTAAAPVAQNRPAAPAPAFAAAAMIPPPAAQAPAVTSALAPAPAEASPPSRFSFGPSTGALIEFPGASGSTITLMGPSHLGGPKTAALPPQAPLAAGADNKKAFLHEAHARACKIFGTVLGPEANAYHRNHFHVDMAVRIIPHICR